MIARKCAHIVVLPLAISLALLILEFYFISSFFLLIFLLFLIFFRDPHREMGEGVISPADGIVMENDGKIAIFMNLWNVHVNRAPVSGMILEMKHMPGKHHPAFRERGDNEYLSIKMDTEMGTVVVVQVAGIIARRIVPYINEGDEVRKGDRIGIIRFGSKVEVYLPENVKAVVKKGDKVKAGQTIGKIIKK